MTEEDPYMKLIDTLIAEQLVLAARLEALKEVFEAGRKAGLGKRGSGW